MRFLAIMLLALSLTGCAEIIFGVTGLISAGVGIYQRYEDRQDQKDQTEEIKNLRKQVETHQEEVRKLNERILQPSKGRDTK